MEWLTPLTALYAAAVSVPLLLLLYFLKLKRRYRIVSSTLVWKRAVQDLQVNAPFQRLRRNILLLLQLVTLIAILVALAGPILSLTGRRGRRYVVLIDRSASMNATDAAPSRLDEAKKQAGLFVESLRSKAFLGIGDKSDQTMVIAFDSHAKVMCNFTSDKRQLVSAIEAISAGDGSSSIAEAVTVAQAFAQSPEEEADYRNPEEPAQLVLFSDGQIRDSDQVVVGADELVFHCIGKQDENIAITAMQARRSYEDPEQVEVFATITNYGTQPVTCDVQLSISDTVHAVRSVAIPARKKEAGSSGSESGKVAVNFSLMYAGAGVLEVRQLKQDALSSDDAAWAILLPPKRLSVMLVTAGNVVLESAIRACPVAGLDIISPDKFDANDSSALGFEQRYDVIVLDNYIPIRLPRCRYLVFGHPPNGIDVSVAGQLENQLIVDWRQNHPLLKYVNLTNIFAAKCFKIILPRDAEVLAEFNESPALALVRRGGSVFVLAGFDILQTNWPFEPSFVLFCYNVAGFLGTQIGQNQETELQVGQPISIEGLLPQTEAKISGPGFSDAVVKSTAAGSIRFPGTGKVGIYAVKIPGQQGKFFAVNLLDLKESNVEPVKRIILSGQRVVQERALSRANLALWPFLVWLALFFVCIEWLVYNRKVRI
jgi:hypothetical protein